jgi:hypothetical protein
VEVRQVQLVGVRQVEVRQVQQVEVRQVRLVEEDLLLERQLRIRPKKL